MSVIVDPRIQELYDRSLAEHRAAGAEITGELEARQKEIAEQIAKNREEFAATGQQLAEVQREQEHRQPARNPEDDDISARAEDYQEPDEDDVPEPSTPPPAPVRAVAAPDEDDDASFRWDDDPTPPPPRQERRRARTRDEEDLSDHDWLE